MLNGNWFARAHAECEKRFELRIRCIATALFEELLRRARIQRNGTAGKIEREGYAGRRTYLQIKTGRKVSLSVEAPLSFGSS
jgi:hypothetical protein